MKLQSANYFAESEGDLVEPRYVAELAFTDSLARPKQNYLKYSEDFTNAVWEKDAGITVTSNTTAAPDGTTTADTLQANAGTANIWQDGITCPNLGAIYRYSIFVYKDSTGRATRAPLFISSIEIGGDATISQIAFDTETGEYNIDFDEGGLEGVRVDDYDANWWRLNIYHRSIDADNTEFDFKIRPNGKKGDAWDQTGTGTQSIIAWGAQIALAAVDEDYIKTTSAQELAAESLVTPNFFTYSEQLDNADWTKSTGITVTANDSGAPDAPDGTRTADKVDDSSAALFGSISQSKTPGAARQHLLSAFVAKDSTPKATRFANLQILFTGGTGGTQQNDLRLDTSTGEILVTHDDSTNEGDPAIKGGIVDIDSNWWRVWILAADIAGDSTGVQGRLYPAYGANSDLSIQGAAATGFVYAWGLQLSDAGRLINYVETAASEAAVVPFNAEVDPFYIGSHSDCQLPSVNGAGGSIYSWDRMLNAIEDISGQTMRVVPDRAQHTIGNITIKVLDVNGTLTDRIKTRLDGGESLRRKRIRFYKGFAGLTDFDDYSLRFTYVIDRVSYSQGVYTIECSDVQRIAKADIFDLHQGVLTSTVNATATSIPITIADAANKFPLLEHDSNYGSDASKTVGYIQIDDEIIRHTGWNTGKTALEVDGASGRGALGTTAATHTVTATEADQKKKVSEYVYIEMAGPRLVYALLTGKILYQSGGMPAHWHLGIDSDFVRLADFLAEPNADLWETSTGQGRMARFQKLEVTEGKRFIEKELLTWMGAFMPVYADGTLGFKRLQNVTPESSYITWLNDQEITKVGPLQHNYKKLLNNFVVQWNYIPAIERYTKLTQLVDSDSVSKHGLAPAKVFTFRGVFTGRHSEDDIRKYFDQMRDRYGHPPLEWKIDVMPRWDLLDVGDVVRVSSAHVSDYNTGLPVDRVFEIQQIRTNWRTGRVSLSLFGGIENSKVDPIVSSSVMSDSFYTAAGTELSTVLTISAGAVTANGTLNGNNANHANAIYYYNGDLTINSGVTVTINKNVQLRVKGFLTVNGKIDGAGQGFAGAAATAAKQGKVGISGASGYSVVAYGIDCYNTDFTNQWITMPPTVRDIPNEYSADGFLTPTSQQKFTSFQGLNVRNPDGLSFKGVPKVLAGTSGAAGQGAAYRGVYQASGGAGGDSGAGLVVICRGATIGPAGSIDLSGDDGTAPGSDSLSDVTWYAGAGQGGFPGAVVFLLDGDVTAPTDRNVELGVGDWPIPDVDANFGFTTEWVYYPKYKSFAYGKNINENKRWNYSGNFGVYYLPDAENGFEWTAADQIAEVDDLAFQLT